MAGPFNVLFEYHTLGSGGGGGGSGDGVAGKPLALLCSWVVRTLCGDADGSDSTDNISFGGDGDKVAWDTVLSPRMIVRGDADGSDDDIGGRGSGGGVCARTFARYVRLRAELRIDDYPRLGAAEMEAATALRDALTKFGAAVAPSGDADRSMPSTE